MDFSNYEPSAEMIEAILLPLEPRDLQNTCRTDSRFVSVCDNEAFWERKVKYDLRDHQRLIRILEDEYVGVSWKMRYVATSFRPLVRLSASIYKRIVGYEEEEFGTVIPSLSIAIAARDGFGIHNRAAETINGDWNCSEGALFPNIFNSNVVEIASESTLRFIFLIHQDYFTDEGYQGILDENAGNLEGIPNNKEDALGLVFQEARTAFDLWVQYEEPEEVRIRIKMELM